MEPLASLIGVRRTIVLTTSRIARFCLPTLKKALSSKKIPFEILTLPDGEQFKNLATVSKTYRSFVKRRADRSTLILLLGGGVLGDLGGFAAATFLRGLPFIQIPTTLVGQVDASIGGKLGVDLPEGKNLVGVFRQPLGVFCHIPFLKTLPPRDLLGGLAEVLKYGVIQDPVLFERVRQEREKILKREFPVLLEIVKRSARIKARIVEQDETETSGLRMILNFGHTFGHALELLTHYRRYHHGEAVALGMSLAGRISARLGSCLDEESQRLSGAIRQIGLPADPPRFSPRRWVEALAVDKKSRQGMIHFVVLRKIGEVTVSPISPNDLVKLL